MSKVSLKPAIKRSLLFAIAAATVMAAGVLFNTPTSDAQAPPDLEALHQRMLPLFEIPGIVFTDADETRGRLVVGVENRGLAQAVQARLTTLGIAVQLVDVIETEPIVQLVTLQDMVRPVEGGLQINFNFFFACTLGFNAERNGVSGFVTNSHCTTTQGGVESTLYYQPLTPDFIGTEIADPTYFSSGACPVLRVCRYSDSAFVEYANGVPASLGYIARPDALGSLNIADAGAGQFRIVSEASAIVGETVNKVGRTTGWTQAPVSNTCVNVNVSGSNITQLCQTLVTSAGPIIIGSGDSGSPVFKVTNSPSTNDVQLVGIAWGGNTGGTMIAFSPISGIELPGELGSLTTEAALTPSPTPTPTSTSVPPTATSVPPTATSVPPTATSVPPTATSVPPTATSVPPTATSVPPTATSVPPTSTATATATPAPGVTVSSITPNSLPKRTTNAATITGAGFLSGASVTFVNGTCGPAPTASAVVVVDANSITASINTKNGGPQRNCTWGVRVTNANASTSVLAGGFTVTP